MSTPTRDRPLAKPLLWVAIAVAFGAGVVALPWDLSHLTTAEGWSSAWARVGSFASAFSPPDLSARTLSLALDLALETLAIAVLGVGAGLVLAYPLAAWACAAFVDDGLTVTSAGQPLVRHVAAAFDDVLHARRDAAQRYSSAV